MRAKRPALKVGDVCRWTHKARRTYKRFKRKAVLTVIGFKNNSHCNLDTDDGRAQVICSVSLGNNYNYMFKETISRRELWFTGYNVHDKTSKGKSKTNYFSHKGFHVPETTPKNNDNRTHCFRCGQPTKITGGGVYNLCANKECVWFEN